MIEQQSVRSIEKRIEELQALEVGWLEGEGEVLSVAGLCRLQQVLAELIGAGLPVLSLYPTPAGGVHAEWSLGSWEVSAEIDLKTCFAYLHAAHMKVEEEVRDALCDLTTEAGKVKMLNFVLEFMPIAV